MMAEVRDLVADGVVEFSRKEKAAWVSPQAIDPGLLEEIEAVKIVDTHEHLETEAQRLARKPDLKPFLYIYTLSELVSAGMPMKDAEEFNGEVPVDRQWKMVRDWWRFARNTPAGIASRLALREFYGVDDLRDSTIGPLVKAMQKAVRPGFYRFALRETAGIECSMINLTEPVQGELCMVSADPDLLLYDISVAPLLADDLKLEPYEKAAGISCSGLSDWKRIIDRQFERWGSRATAIKNQCAYWRTLKFENVKEEEAAPLFEKWLLRKEEVTPAERRAVQDWTFHHCIRRATDLDLPVKIHTGYHAWNNYSDPSWFQPKDLARLFRRYPRTRFDLFHIGYPEHRDVVALAKHYANVWVDLCWAWLLDTAATLKFVRQCVGAIPLNKVFGFGGDTGFPDYAFGHARMARDGIGLALTQLMHEGRLTRDDARQIARAWLRDNAMEMFRIEERRKAARMGEP